MLDLDIDLPHVLTAFGAFRFVACAKYASLRLLSDSPTAHPLLHRAASLVSRAPVLPKWVDLVLKGLSISGTVFYVMLYFHNMRIFMNRKGRCNTSVWRLMGMIRPLQALFRLITVPFRVVPDVAIIGEVRCGTTTTARYLEQHPSAHRPFCLWRVGFADNKETFYMTGQYLGLVHPFFYRMAFPTIFEKYWSIYVTGRGFFTYDACAQYATAPWVPALLKRANPDMKIIMCLREPVSQNVSWFNFEKGNEKYFGEMLDTDVWEERLPANTMRESFEGSLSKKTSQSYKKAEQLEGPVLPLWAQTWPEGQSFALGRMGHYAMNIERYYKHFPKENVHFVNQMEDLNGDQVQPTIRRVASILPPTAVPMPEETVVRISQDKLHVNASVMRHPSAEDATLKQEMREYYQPLNAELEDLIGRKLNWK